MSEQGRVAVNDARDGELDLGAVGRALMRKRWWVLGPALAVAALTFVGVNLITPKFKSEARVLIEGRENVFVRPVAEQNSMDRERTVDQEAVTSQVQLALSRDLARQVIKQLKLGELPEFDSTLRGVSLIRYSLGFLGLAKDPLSMTPEERVLEAYYERLTVFQVDKSRVISIEFQSADPELAAKVANAVAENYLSFQQNARQEQTRAAGRWLAGEIEGMRKRVAEAEAKVEDFRSKTNLFVGPNGTTLSSQTLGESNRDLAAARSQRAELEAKSKFIRDVLKRGAPVEYSDMINSELIRRLNEQRVTLRAQLAEQSSTLLDAHPRIKELKAQISDLDRQIRDEAARLARSFENDARIAGARVESLQASLDQLKQLAASTNGQDVELRAFEREAKAQRDLLESYLAKYRETTARDSLGSAPTDTRIISRALVSNTPYFPKKLPIVLVATLAALFISAGFITTGELLAGNVYRAGTPVEAPAEPVPAVAEQPAPSGRSPHPSGAGCPRASSAPRRPTSRQRSSPSRAWPRKRAAELRSPQRTSRSTISRPRCARQERAGNVSPLSAPLRATARRERPSRSPERSRRMHVSLSSISHWSIRSLPRSRSTRARPGIADLVRGTASFGQIITRDRISRAQVVPAGRVGTDAAMIFMSERLNIAMDALSRSYDHVVIDAGAAPYVPADRIARLASCGVLVAGNVAAEAANTMRDHLAHAGFSDIALFTGTAPALDAESIGSVAA